MTIRRRSFPKPTDITVTGDCGWPERAIRAGRALLPAAFGGVLLALSAQAVRWDATPFDGPVLALSELAEPGRATLIQVLQPADCPDGLGILRTWNDIHASGVVAVQGVVLRSSRSEKAGRILSEAGAEFPARVGAERAATRALLRLGFEQTPVTLLLDESGRIVLALPPRSHRRADPLIGAAVTDLVSRLQIGVSPDP